MGKVRGVGPRDKMAGKRPTWIPFGVEGLGASTATEMVKAVEGLLRKATITLWLMRNKEQNWKEEEYRNITT